MATSVTSVMSVRDRNASPVTRLYRPIAASTFAHFVKANVRVHEYPDGELAVYWGPHRLADYDASGVLGQPAPDIAPPKLSRVG
jgi:hypothetical protein